MKDKHSHLSSPEVECEECGGEVEILNETFPKAYECKCKKCGHKFDWVEAKEDE